MAKKPRPPRELPAALRENADRLKRGEALHKQPKPTSQKPKIRTRHK